MKFEIWRFETKQGVDYRIGTQDQVRHKSELVSVFYSPTKEGAVNTLKTKLAKAIEGLHC